jgi:hypothetical protein
VRPEENFWLEKKMPDKYKPPYQFSALIGAACARQFRTFPDLHDQCRDDLLRKPVD